MENVPVPEPGPEMRARFYQMIEAYEQGRRETERERLRPRGFWHWWPQQPSLQFAMSMALVACSIAATYVATNRGNPVTGTGNHEITQLRGEVQNMRQLVTLSLLQQQSASDRLQGVTWSYRVQPSDTEVLSALLHTMNQDASVDVRLAAVDALHSFSDSPVARRGLSQSLVKQDSPLVQIAIIDLLVDLKEKPAAPAMKSLLASNALDPNVRKRIESALKQLS
jgi:HEAT repeat protein